MTAFVIWERTQREADAALDRALALGAVKLGDPIILGVMPGSALLPASRWTDALTMADEELEALADLPPTTAVVIGDVRRMTDADLSSALIASVARPASYPTFRACREAGAAPIGRSQPCRIRQEP